MVEQDRRNGGNGHTNARNILTETTVLARGTDTTQQQLPSPVDMYYDAVLWRARVEVKRELDEAETLREKEHQGGSNE